MLILFAGIMWLCINWKSANAWVKKWQSEHPLLSFLLTLILGALIYIVIPEISNIALIQPTIESYLHPPIEGIVLDPRLDPMPISNGNHVIRVNVLNNGTVPLENIWVDYMIKGAMNASKRTFLKNNMKLLPSDADFFEFEVSGINKSCATYPQPVLFQFYKDKQGKEYVKYENVTSKICVYRLLEINITARDFSYSSTYEYPYFDGALMLSVIPVSGALPYENAENKSELVHLERDVKIWMFDTGTACLRGDFDAVWCRQYISKIPPRK